MDMTYLVTMALGKATTMGTNEETILEECCP
jgi:hypothetical protein